MAASGDSVFALVIEKREGEKWILQEVTIWSNRRQPFGWLMSQGFSTIVMDGKELYVRPRTPPMAMSMKQSMGLRVGEKWRTFYDFIAAINETQLDQHTPFIL